MSQTAHDPIATPPIGRTIRKLRVWRSLSQQALADQAGVAMATVQRIERGHPPTVVNLIRLARALDVTPNDLLEDDVA